MITAFFPPLLPEEPLGCYHWRMAAYAGIQNCRLVRAEHLGAPGRAVDLRLPRNLICLMQTLSCTFPNMPLSDLVSLHTDYPYYAASLCESARKALLARMCNHSDGPLRPQRALTGEDAFLAQRLWCRKCITADEEAYGCAYVHRYSTLPCVGLCPIHGIPLLQQCVPGVEPPSTADNAFANTYDFCRASNELLLSPSRIYHLPRVLAHLADTGFATKAGRVRMRSLAEAVALTYSDGFQQSTLTAMTCDDEHVKAWLTSVVSPNCHPVHYLLLMGGIRPRTAIAPTLSRRSTIAADEIYVRALDDVRRGMSVRSVSDRIGVSEHALLCKARAAGIPFKARAKWIFSLQRRQVQDALARGESIGKICRRQGISLSSAYRILAASTETRRKREAALLVQQLERYRSTWLGLVSAHPFASRSELRQREPSTWAWLSRNDQAWLVAHEPNPQRCYGHRGASVPSAGETAEAISRVRSAVAKLGKLRPLTIQRILDAAGIPSAAHVRLLRSGTYKAELTRQVSALTCGGE